MDNRHPDHALPRGALRNAVNIDIDTTGQVRRRAGYTKVVGGVGFRGGYSCPLGAFVIRGTELCRLNADRTLTVLLSGVTGPTPAYTYFNNEVYFTDGVICKVISASGVRDWGQPIPPPSTNGISLANAATGTYLVAVTTLDTQGRESGASDVSVVTVTNPNGTGTVTATSTARRQVYVSKVNGVTLYLNGTGAELKTRNIGPPPPGQLLANYRGRIYVASGSVLWVSEPFAPDWFHRIAGFIQFPEDITVCLVVDKGVYVVSDQMYFLRGSGPEDFVMEPGLPYRGVYGTGTHVPFSQDVVWYSERGLIYGTADGQMKNLQEDFVAPDSGTQGAAIVREQDGLRQVITSIQNPSVSSLAASSWIEMEVVRKAGGHTP
jgi:hypothetical protein